MNPVRMYRDVRTRSVADAEFGQCLRGTAIPRGQRNIALVLYVLPTHLGGVEAGRSEIAEVAEEQHTVMHLRPCLRRPRDIVEDLTSLGIARADEGLRKAVLAFVVEPGE